MGCECSDPKKGEEKLLNEAESNIKPQTRTPSSIEDEAGSINEHPKPKSKSKTKSKSSNRKWYFDPPEIDGNIVDALTILIGEQNKHEIENAISTINIKDDIHAVTHYLLNKALDVIDITDEKSKYECKEGIDGCSSLARMLLVFEIYISWINGKKSQSLYDLVYEKLAKDMISDKQILDDFHHLLLHHNTDKDFETIYNQFKNKNLIISIDKSEIIIRNYRERNTMNGKRRKQMYYTSDSQQVIFIKLLDRIYCFYIYSFDIGMRLKSKEKLQILYATDEEKEHNSDDEGSNGNIYGKKDNKLVCMSSILKKKQINLLNVMGKNNIEKNRYCTNNIDINVSFADLPSMAEF